MQAKIKFPSQKNPEFYNELKEAVNDYFKKKGISRFGNYNLVIKTIIMMVLYFGPYLLILSGFINSFTLIFLAWIVMGIGMAGLGMGVMHDGAHRAFSKYSVINKGVANSIYLLGGFPHNWAYQHNTLHHTYTNITGSDEDIDPGSILRFSPHEPLRKAHRYQHIYGWFLYGLMTFSWVTDKDFLQLKRYKDNKVNLQGKLSYNQLFILLILSKIVYYGIFLVIPILFFPISWYWTIVMFLVMHFTGGFILTIVFQTAHVVPTSEYPLPDKEGLMENNWAVHQLLTTSDFSPKNKLFSWYIGGLNYQIEHHLFPGVSHVHYAGISKFVREKAEKFHYPYHVHNRFFKAVFEHGKMLKRLGRA